MRFKIILAVALTLPSLLSCKTPKGAEQVQKPATKSLPQGITVRDVTWRGDAYRVITVDTASVELRTASYVSTNGQVHNFETLKKVIEREGHTLSMAVNAGMFHRNMDPVGLYIENSITFSPLNLQDGIGNFFLKPNGFFALTQSGPVVAVSEKFPLISGVRFATQSGPMLVIDGAIHPRFDPNSTNFNIRSGVGVTAGRFVHLVISLETVRLYDFADFYLNGLSCVNALYLDGHISQAYVRGQYENLPTQDFGTFLFTE